MEYIKQHDHARVAYELAIHWKEEAFPFPNRKEDVLYAIRNHDCAWIPLDQSWNMDKAYDFTNYPLERKLSAYEKGIDEVQKQTSYGAWLCSAHYTSFFQTNAAQSSINQFLEKEEERRYHILNGLESKPTELQLRQHLHLLQFCDDLSLYICMNQPGATKEEEVCWFRNGFRQTFPTIPEKMIAHWQDERSITINPFPFKQTFTVSFPVTTVDSLTSTKQKLQREITLN